MCQTFIQRFLSASLLFALFSTPPLACAEEGANLASADLKKLSIEQLMEVEVNTVYGASRYPQKVSEAPSSVTIVTADEIKKYGHRTLADILRSVRSFYVTNDRNYSYIGVRGFGRTGDYSSRILLLMDGHRLNDNLYDSASLDSEFPVDVDLISRVEVVRGPGSSLYGNNAFFAVINVITREGDDIGGVETSAETGSFDTYKGRITYGNSFGNGASALVSGTYYNSGGDRLFFKEFATPANNFGITDHTDFDRHYSTLARLSYADFTLEGLYSSRTKGIPTGAYGIDFNDRRNRTTDSFWFANLKYARSFGENSEIMGRLSYNSYDYHGDYVYSGVVNKDLGLGAWWGGELQGSFRLPGGNRVMVGTEYRDNFRQNQENYDEAPYAPYLYTLRSSRIWALFLQDEFTILENLILNAGVRYDHYSTFGGTVNPRLALIYTPFTGTVFKFLYGSAFRAPNVYELYYDIPSQGQKGNPSLGPEKIGTYELVYEQELGRLFRGTVSGFYYSIGNLIVQVDDGSGVAMFRNLDRAEADGVEAELDMKLDNGVTGRVSYTFQDAWNGTTGQTLVNSPRHLAKLNVSLPLLQEKIFLGIEEQFTSGRKTLVPGDAAKSFFITNLTLFSKNILQDLELSASVYNLFDCRYGDPGGAEHIQDPGRFVDPGHPLDIIRQDGRTFRVKLTYKF
ncbi:MAG TPA: TonB-dependent receptor [Geobacteraceae bacterium]